MDYSKTVNLPETDFPMRANLPKREPDMLARWEEKSIYEDIISSRKDGDLYILHDGPPYANGHIHIGHALNKILKDFIVKHKTMMGYRVPYVPGWDCHGLPIELNVTKKLGNKTGSMERIDIRKGCREYAEEFVEIQKEEFCRLGVFAEYDRPYKTLSREYESDIVRIFGEIMEKGFIYRSKKPIYWCPSCVTALAEAEVEYGEHTSESIYVKFPVVSMDPGIKGMDSKNVYVIIWTTTPWTIPANLAVSFHPDFPYSASRFGDEWYVMARGLVEDFERVTGNYRDEEVEMDRVELESLKVMHPFVDRESKVLFGDHVTLEQGTGVVHTAPGHGLEDYIIGKEYDLDIFCPVDDHGKYTHEFSLMQGVNVFDANEKVLDLLKEKKALIHSESFRHSYPHCWRCKKPLIFRATEQWFFSIDHNELREKAKNQVDETKWVPTWGENRFRSMVESRPDWCLSRQRSWGVPIPSFRCASCDENQMSHKTVAYFAHIAREKGIDSWYTDELEELIPPGHRCSCGSIDFYREYDILDVWFDSGVSHFAVLERRDNLRWPADLYLEGSDQHRGWFQSSLWPALALRDRAPYRAVLTHGFVLDEEGKAMSKSMGNVIAPEKIIQQYGADILRLWVSSEDYRSDLRIGMDMIKQIADSYRKIRNTFKFILGNLSDFSEEMMVSYNELSEVDKWILHRLYQISESVVNHYETFEFHLVYRRILNFCAVELSSIYFDITKDILYVELRDHPGRRAVQTVLEKVYRVLVRLLAPILPFTAEEIWIFREGETGSVHRERYYLMEKEWNNPSIAGRVEKLVEIKTDVLKALEEARREKKIKASLEAEIDLFIQDKNKMELVESLGREREKFFQVAKVHLLDEKREGMLSLESSEVGVRKTEGKKCVRCWNYFDELGPDQNHPELCERCTSVIKQLNEGESS